MDKFKQSCVINGVEYPVEIEASPEFMIRLIDEKIAQIDRTLAEMERLRRGNHG